MHSLVTENLRREVENDRLRIAGYRSRVERRRRDRQARVRKALGLGLVSAGERLLGTSHTHHVATVPPLRRS